MILRAKYLLDTNILSEPLQKTPNAAVMARLHGATGLVAIASVVCAASVGPCPSPSPPSW